MKRILITGGAGFIGSNLVRRMVQSGYVVMNLDCLTYAGNLHSLETVASRANYSFSKTDIADSQAVHRSVFSFRPDGIMHLAAESHVDRSIDGPQQFINTNVIGTFNLLQAALDYWRNLSDGSKGSFRFLHVSTDEVYGSLGLEGKFGEETRYDPHSPYSASKAGSDHLVRAWNSTYGLPTLVTNCSNNYGPFQFPEKLIPVVILKCLRGESIPIYGQGENIRDWLYVEDHCAALELVLNRGVPGQTYNIGGDNEQRNIDLARTLCELVDQEWVEKVSRQPCSTLITLVADRPGHDLRYSIDASKIRQELGWRPKQDQSSGFRSTVRWYLDNQSWWNNILSGDYKLQRQGLGE